MKPMPLTSTVGKSGGDIYERLKRSERYIETPLNVTGFDFFSNSNQLEIDSVIPTISAPNISSPGFLMDLDFLREMVDTVVSTPMISQSNFGEVLSNFTDRFREEQIVIGENFESYENSISDFRDSLNELSDVVESLFETSPDVVGEGDDSIPLPKKHLKFLELLDNIEKKSKHADDIFNILINSVPELGLEAVIGSGAHQAHADGLSILIELMLKILKETTDSNIETLKSQAGFSKLMNQAKLEAYKTKAAEMEKKNEASKRLSKFLTIFGAVFGVALSIIGIITAIPTGGASVGAVVGLCVAIAGGVLAVVDTVLTFTIDFSPVGWLMDKLMQGVSYVLEQTLTKLVELIAKECGADNEKVDDVKKYFNMVASAVIVIVVIVLISCAAGSGSGAAKGTGAVATKVGSKTGSKIVAQEIVDVAGKETGKAAVKQALGTSGKIASELIKVASNAGKTTTEVAGKLVKTRHFAKILSTILAILEGSASGGVNIADGIYQNQALKILAELGLDKQDIEVIQKLYKENIETINSFTSQLNEIRNMLLDNLSNRYQSLNAFIRNSGKQQSVKG